ncbi:MAG: hypothetical protein B6D72_09240 [gamma proteobacterium symbiont of Ctena orbiculata]|uniref:DUF1801 domain-containing protein n=1 Tax=Candidatus Thiodiazotropha taylori TaxID=2792791 RepID=A0A944QVE2_9GAMM|nr:DUF1801 domain-containing protein [Candidatus Thiodiazotropha taylori]PUB85149.1 MAG: DUF1801 domain-containing protein [gamma proteobacterium symbiont of Ctena orbiculata]MBT2989341.1 DUF1801 domain-containing protein [Candidatus Thiodiazotropha taylori]MBT2996921.1 DUF1801 domain-containing protein [Candidatus Thiodiazotropha taylori]MBT3000776.1 DUF1801 domain-containing protein [Candidatus Thiodiazotropha taylori]
MNNPVEAYFESLPEERRTLLGTLHRLIIELYPDATVDMKYRMPTYHTGEGWVAIANQKNYVSLYTCGEHHLTRFKKKHPKIKTGKGCINFRINEKLPLFDVKRVVKHALDSPKGERPRHDS